MVEMFNSCVEFSFLAEGAMANYRPDDYSQRVMIPVSLEHQLMPGTLEFAIHTLVETRINRAIFDNRYGNDERIRLKNCILRSTELWNSSS